MSSTGKEIETAKILEDMSLPTRRPSPAPVVRQKVVHEIKVVATALHPDGIKFGELRNFLDKCVDAGIDDEDMIYAEVAPGGNPVIRVISTDADKV